MAQSINGKSAIVTGAGSGINLEFARLLLEGGANVLFADLALRPEAETLVSKYENGSPRAVFQKTDVTSWADLDSMFVAAVNHFGSVDIVCPGAGVFEPPFSNFWYPPGTSPSKDTPQGDRYKLLDINITHPIRTTQMALSHFLNASPPSSATNPKTIVHIASIAGETAFLFTPMYVASKHAITGFVRSMGDLEAVSGVRVAAVAPGVVKTPLWTDNPEKLRIVKQDGEDKDPWVTPEEVAKVMLAIVERDEISSKLDESQSDREDETIAIKGGSILRVTTGLVTDVPLFNNPGPYGLKGTSVTNAKEANVETIGLLKPGWGKAA